MLAGVGAGLFGGRDEGVERCYRVRERVSHTPASARLSRDVFERYLETRPAAGAAT